MNTKQSTDSKNSNENQLQQTTTTPHGYGKDIGYILLFIFIVLGCIVLFFVNKRLMIQSVAPYIQQPLPTPTISL